ncbi:nucleotidyltransferase [Jiella endophytica]|uniref:Nucleotidyltransferase n=1 Tax=Jiella endophytica TaxID=2558362 RepID=A0A4Y8RDR2_9HYPH|nr:nucleotidyltransferase [Jiella endophytica]TFF19872.1 nucleotidyltransferase [Jiella endophytica]
MNIRANIDESLAIDPVEAALMDLARSIQLTPTMHREATRRYESLAEYVDREGSPLQDEVKEVYPSGSFAIHAAIRSDIKREQHDVDAVLEILVAQDADPATVLDALEKAIVGESGGGYRGREVERNSRCITVHYTDGVTVDLMPVVRLPNTPERVANLFHHNEEKGESYRKQVNPKGFANHFNEVVEISAEFAKRFDTRRFIVEGATYAEQLVRDLNAPSEVLTEKAETQPMPDFLPLDQKAPRVVALQILKRFRDKRYRKHDDHRGQRKPPSVVMAALALEATPIAPTLTDELIAVAETIRNAIVAADLAGRKLEVRNPAHEEDIFTDRWPEDRHAQRLWAADLIHLVNSLRLLKAKGFDPVSVKKTFDDLFGEDIADRVLEEHYRVHNAAVLSGNSKMTHDGRPVSPAVPARPTSPRHPRPSTPAIIGGAAASGLITPARANTSMGGVIPDDDH